MDADGSNKVQLTTDTSDDIGPSWNPSGDRIVFMSDRSGNYDIWMLTLESASPALVLTFQETFEDLNEWDLVVYDSAGGSGNDPAPCLDTTMGQSAPSLDVNGDSWCGDGAYTKRTFDYSNGLAIEFDMYVASGHDWNWGNGGLSDHMPNLDNPRSDGAYVDPLRCDPGYLAGIFFNDDGCYNQCPPTLGFAIHSEDGSESYQFSSDASSFQNEWHTYKINILPDGYVEFYMDGIFIWKPTEKIDKALSPMPLVFGERDAYGPVRIDNVKVFQPTPPVYDTPIGTDVRIEIAEEDMDITFDDVTESGQTWVAVSSNGPAFPSGFNLSGNYYDITTTASYTGYITICINYDESQVDNEVNLELLHYEDGAWVSVSTSLDTDTNTICGTVTSLSPFIVAEHTAIPGDLDGDGDVDSDDVNIIKVHCNQSAIVCPECDIDGDGTITVLDARKLMLMCTCPRCICD